MRKFERDDLEHFHDEGVYLPTRTISLMETIDEEAAAALIRNLHILDSKQVAPITIFLKTFGGCLYNAAAIYDAIDDCKSEITCIAHGYCMSAGTLILQAADLRVLTPHTRFMVHYGWDATDDLHHKDFIRGAEESKFGRKVMEDIYLERIREKHPRYTRKKLQELMQFDRYMSAEETIKLGLADKILGE